MSCFLNKYSYKIKAPPRATVARAMAPLRKGACWRTAPFLSVGVDVEDAEGEETLTADGVVEVPPEPPLVVAAANVRI